MSAQFKMNGFPMIEGTSPVKQERTTKTRKRLFGGTLTTTTQPSGRSGDDTMTTKVVKSRKGKTKKKF